MTAPLVDMLDASPAARRIEAAVHRALADLDVPGADLPAVIAVRVLADPQVRDGQAALGVLERLRARHQPVRWADGSQVVVCGACSTAWPCPDAELVGAA